MLRFHRESRAHPLRHGPASHRSGGLSTQTEVRRRGRAAPAEGALSRNHQRQHRGPRASQEANGRPWTVRRLPGPLRAPGAGRRLRVRKRGLRRRHPQGVHPGNREGNPGGEDEGLSSPGTRWSDFKATVYDGKYHAVDSSEMAFKIAGSLAFKEAMERCRPTLLEPIMNVEITVPEDTTGDVLGDLNSRRGRTQGMEPKGSMTRSAPRCRCPRCSPTSPPSLR